MSNPDISEIVKHCCLLDNTWRRLLRMTADELPDLRKTEGWDILCEHASRSADAHRRLLDAVVAPSWEGYTDDTSENYRIIHED